MLARRIDKEEGKKDSYRDLSEYVSVAEEDKGEKLEECWLVNFNAGETRDDLPLAIIEGETVQALNTTAECDRAYHLLITFQEGEHPTSEQLRYIEEEFCKDLGFGEHQRVVATHRNTKNFHMHVSINKIHPTTFKCHTPFQDYPTMSKTARRLEQELGLKVDKGYESKRDYPNTKAQDYEAHTWQQSFLSYVLERKDKLMDARDRATTWHDLHCALAEEGLGIKPRGNGFIIRDTSPYRARRHIKASSLDRLFSKDALEKHLGPYQEPDLKRLPPAKSHYRARPKTTHRATKILWQRYEEQTQGKHGKGWKAFLQQEAIRDPMALAILRHHKSILRGIANLLDGGRGVS